jgi:hypothetical protein
MIFALGLGRYAIVDRNGKPVHGELDSSSSEVEAWLRTDPKNGAPGPSEMRHWKQKTALELEPLRTVIAQIHRDTHWKDDAG